MCSGLSFFVCPAAGTVQLKTAVTINAKRRAWHNILYCGIDGTSRTADAQSNNCAVIRLSMTFCLSALWTCVMGGLNRATKGKVMEEIRIVDTTLRDEQRIYTHPALPPAPHHRAGRSLRHKSDAAFRSLE